MRDNQVLTPKYWVGHHKDTDDVLFHTMSKTRDVVLKKMEEEYGEDWFMDDNFEIISIEVRQTQLIPTTKPEIPCTEVIELSDAAFNKLEEIIANPAKDPTPALVELMKRRTKNRK